MHKDDRAPFLPNAPKKVIFDARKKVIFDSRKKGNRSRIHLDVLESLDFLPTGTIGSSTTGSATEVSSSAACKDNNHVHLELYH